MGPRFYALLTAVFVALTTAFFLRSRLFAACCDASGYLVLGQTMWTKGLFAKLVLSDLRTIGYPAFIAFTVWLPLPLSLDLKVVVLQSFLYWASATALVASSRPLLSDRPSRRALAVGLLGNPLAAMYCADTMTESLSLTIFLACVALLLRVREKLALHRRGCGLPFGLGILVGLALVVRPANLAFVIAAFLAMAIPPLWGTETLKRRLLQSASSLIALSAGLYLAVSPQVAVNLKHFDKATPLPAASLGTLQMREGIRHLKYATFVGTPKVQQVRYASPFARGTEVLPADTFGWYLRYPGRGLLTIAGHIFATIALDPLFTYVRDLEPWYRIPVVSIDAVVIVFGFGWLVRGLWRRRRQAAGCPVAWFLLGSMVLSLGIVAFAIPESRFGFLTNSVCFASVCGAAARAIAGPIKLRLAWMVAGIAGSAAFSLLALGLRRLANI